MTKPKLIILFGSKATGRAGRNSDTDVAVLAEAPLTLDDKDSLGQDLGRQLSVSEDNIDIIDLQTAPPLLQQQIAAQGQLLAGSNDDWLRWRVLAWKRYLNTVKFRRLREQVLKQSIHA